MNGKSRQRRDLLRNRCMVCAIALLSLCLSGCKNDDMAEQPKLKPYQPAPLFADRTEARPLVAGTVARPAGKVPGSPYSMVWAPGPVGFSDAPKTNSIPVPITPQLLRRGQERFNIYCSECHGRLGDGNGMVVQRGMIRPPSFHNDRLADPVKSPDSHFYDVISNGRGAMFSYAERVAPDDRWAVIAYIRALQESVRQSAKEGRLSSEEYSAMKGVRP